MSLEKQVQRWLEARLIDSVTVERILQFEKEAAQKRPRWPAILAVSFGTLMLCAGVLLFVAAHWDELSPSQRFLLVLVLVGVFHIAAGLLASRVPAVGVALHVAGTATLGAGIFLTAQIFNLEEHWPGGILLWSLGAVLGWLILRQWPQALLAAVLIPWWLGGEWSLSTERYRGAWNIAAQGFVLLAIFYMSVPRKESNRHLRLSLVWVGGISFLPFLGSLMWSGEAGGWFWRDPSLPARMTLLGYAAAYVPVLLFAALARKKESWWMFASAAWVLALGAISRHGDPEHNAWLYLWLALGACGLCLWGVRENRKLFVNYGIALFALTVIAFYFSEVMDKLGRSMGLILLGAVFLAGGWVLHRVRADLLARAVAGGESR